MILDAHGMPWMNAAVRAAMAYLICLLAASSDGIFQLSVGGFSWYAIIHGISDNAVIELLSEFVLLFKQPLISVWRHIVDAVRLYMLLSRRRQLLR